MSALYIFSMVPLFKSLFSETFEIIAPIEGVSGVTFNIIRFDRVLKNFITKQSPIINYYFSTTITE